MKDRTIYFYLAAILTVVVPVPGRLAFGLLMVVVFNVQVMTGVLVGHLTARLHLDDLKNVIVAVNLVAVTILFKQLVIFFCPVAALTLGFSFYLPALASAIIEFSYKEVAPSLAADIKEKALRNAVFSAVALGIYLVRDLVGFGTVTFPVWRRIAVVHVPFGARTTAAGAFFATIPGAFVLVAVLLALYLLVTGQFAALRRAGGER
ncbi:MAG: hypothetical protein K2O09_04990 [Treponemataceae bacterium]|nr:hypothetical protein [Treponemataceae bacterium]